MGEKQLRLHILGFRIMAPMTPQRTALQKNRSPDSGAIVNTEFLNIKNGSFHGVQPSCLSEIFMQNYNQYSTSPAGLSRENAHFLTALTFGRVSGYIGVIEICGDADITSVAVHPDFRRMGIGKKLLDTAENEAVNRNCESITLEVRESNLAAISLYLGSGYKQVGIRKNFYEKPTENAVLMTKQLTEK